MLRELTQDDIPAAFELSRMAGWNQTTADWRRLLDVEPHGCWCIVEDGRLAATTTLICYGTDLAWIGMVLTHPDFRRRGFARTLLIHALSESDRRGVRCVKLDATADGRPLYQSMGFVDEQPVERWHRSALTSGSDLDRRAFGADRSQLLAALPGITRPGLHAHYLGPIVAGDPDRARELITALVSDDRPWYWDLLPANACAAQLASELGFSRVRTLTRMARGEPVQGDDTLVYALAGFEWG